MNNFLRDKRVSIICHCMMAVLVLPYILMYKKTDTLLFINSHHQADLDLIMYHITRLPELAFIVFVIVLGVFAEKRTLVSILLALSVCGLSILLFKEVIFPDIHRPYHWLNGQHIAFHQVKGIHLHSNGSFPSGHTMSAFCALALIGFISKNGWVQFLMFLLACLSGYSRVYVAQHYLTDVYAGALIGYTIALLFTFIAAKGFKTPYWKQPLLKFGS